MINLIDTMQITAVVLIIIGMIIFFLRLFWPDMNLWIPIIPLGLGWAIIFVRKILTFSPSYREYMRREKMNYYD